MLDPIQIESHGKTYTVKEDRDTVNAALALLDTRDGMSRHDFYCAVLGTLTDEPESVFADLNVDKLSVVVEFVFRGLKKKRKLGKVLS